MIPMETSSQQTDQAVRLTLFGVGSAGVNMLEQVANTGLAGAKLVAVNADTRSLLASSVAEKICLESKPMRGLGTGGDPERGRTAADQCLPLLKDACAGAHAVFVLAGLGGGTGTGVSPVLAQCAREAGALVVAFVTTPFECEGNRRQQQAALGLDELKSMADAVICLPNQKLFRLIDENSTVLDTFRLSDQMVAEGVGAIARLISGRGLIQLHFQDLCSTLRDRHSECHFAAVEAAGAARSREATEKLLSHPMLDGGAILNDADAVLVSITGGTDLTMADVKRVMDEIGAKCPRAQVTMGTIVDAQFQERMAVTLVATRRTEPVPRSAGPGDSLRAPLPGTGPELNTQMHQTDTGRPQSRFIPPPPEMSPEKRAALLSTRGGRAARSGKAAARLRQGQLPLDIVSKGRFDQSEPTIHKGEDLDVPTYIRRGVALN